MVASGSMRFTAMTKYHLDVPPPPPVSKMEVKNCLSLID